MERHFFAPATIKHIIKLILRLYQEHKFWEVSGKSKRRNFKPPTKIYFKLSLIVIWSKNGFSR